MNIKLLYILGACSLMISTTVFASDPALSGTSPFGRALDAQHEYQTHGDDGNYAKKAYNGYQNLDQNQQDTIKGDEVQHRQDIYTGRVNSGYYEWVQDDTRAGRQISQRRD